MARLIFHFGMNKTGSTAIQSSLAAAEGKSFLYPALGEPPYKPHHEDAVDQIFSNERLLKSQMNSEEKTNLAAIAERSKQKIRDAADCGDLPVVLSSEGAYRYLTLDDVKGLRQFVEPLFDDIQLVAYVREPFGFISAAFHNWIKGHGLARFTLKYQPYRRFAKFDSVFGRETVRLLKYDRSSFPGGDVVAHFCDSVGLPRLESAPVNVTLCRPAVSAIYRLNRLAADGSWPDAIAARKLRKSVIRQFPHGDWPKFRLSPRAIAPVVERYADDLHWLEERMGCSMRESYPAQDGDVRDETDLLRIAPDAMAALEAFAEGLPEEQRELLRAALSE